MRDKIGSDDENSSFRNELDNSISNDNNLSEINCSDAPDEMSDTTETEIISALVTQSEYYESAEAEIRKKDTEKTLQGYIKKIFRQVKFLTDSGKNYKEPNFVHHIHEQKSQAAELCEYLWKCLGK